MNAPPRNVIAAFIAIVFLAGANIIVVRVSNFELAPFWGAALRFLVAGIILTVGAAIAKLPFPKRGALLGSAMYGLLGFGVAYAVLYWALVGLNAGLFAIFGALVPLMTFFLAWSHGLERFRWTGLVAAVIVVAGVTLILQEQLSLDVPVKYLIGGLLAPLAIAESGIAAKFVPRTHPVTTNAVAMLVGAAYLFAFSLLVGEQWTLPTRTGTWWALVWLIAFGSVVMFVLFLFILARWTASAVSYQMVLSPIVAITLAWIFLDETITWTFLLGSIIVMGGVFLALQRPKAVPATPVVAQQSAASASDGPRP